MKFLLVLTALLLSPAHSAEAEEGIVLVAVGERGQRMSSRDGMTFGHHRQWENGEGDEDPLTSVCYGNGVFVAAGGSDLPRVVLTVDGRAWEEIDPDGFEDGEGPAAAVLFAEDHFYLITPGGSLFRSGDGRQWALAGQAPLGQAPKPQLVREMAFGNGVFVATGDYGAIAVSSDLGRSWATMTAPLHGSEPVWPSVAFGNGVFVIAGAAGYTATSRDGFHWENETTHDGRYLRASHLSWTGREFFASAEAADRGPFFRLMTRDGGIWTAYQPGRRRQPQEIWRFGDMYFGISTGAGTGKTRLLRSRNTREWEILENTKGFSVLSMASNLPTPPAHPVSYIPVERQTAW